MRPARIASILVLGGWYPAQNRAAASAIVALTLAATLAVPASATATTFTVTTTADTGPGSFRQALLDANANPGADEIVFALPSQAHIYLYSPLPQIEGSSLTITGPGASNLLIIKWQNAGAFRVLDIGPLAPAVTISGVALQGGRSPLGAGINIVGASGQTVTILDSVIQANFATAGSTTRGGGIAVGSGTALTIRRSLLYVNSSGTGGAIYLAGDNPLVVEDSTLSGNSGYNDFGGGLYQSGTAPVTIRGSTINGNTALSSVGQGGGLFFSGGAGALPVITIENSTLSGNGAGQDGGGIALSTATGTLTITHSTIAVNIANGTAAGRGGGGLFIPVSATFTPTLRNTIVDGNTNANGPDILAPGPGGVNVNYSAIGSHTGWTPSATSGDNLPFGTNLMLEPLADNGGPTQTHHLGPNSPPVNAGDPAFVPPPDFDQRGPGFPRVVGGVIDIGSVERDPVPVELQDFTVQ
jgi:hypothetical protein